MPDSRWIRIPVARLCRCGLIVTMGVFPIATPAAFGADETAADEVKQLRRLELIGPEIIRGKNYTIHVPAGTPNLICPSALKSSSASPEQRETRRQELQNKMTAISRVQFEDKSKRMRYYSGLMLEYNKQHEAGKIGRHELEDLAKLAMAENDAIGREPLPSNIQAELDALNAEMIRVQRILVIHLQHEPESPEDTILPMTGNRPTEAFIREFSNHVMPLLKSCGSPDVVRSVHYYANEYGGNYRSDQSIVTFPYRIEDGQLTYDDKDYTKTGNAAIDNRVGTIFGGFDARDPAQNRELTLAGYYEVLADRKVRGDENARQRAIFAAEYRKAHTTAAGRKPGVVYLLDDYWYEYEDMDYTRRIFDGDFALRDEPEFPLYFNIFAEVYTAKCKKFINSFVTYPIPTSSYAGTDWHLDGSRTVFIENGVVHLPIASRFDPYWGNFRPAANWELMSRMWTRLKQSNARNLMRLSIKEFFETIKKAKEIVFVEYSEFEQFIDDRQCGSATVEQLAANFEKAAKGLPSMQEAGVQLAGADAESDPVTDGSVVAAPSSVVQARTSPIEPRLQSENPAPQSTTSTSSEVAQPATPRVPVEQAPIVAAPISEPVQPAPEPRSRAELAAENVKARQAKMARQTAYMEKIQALSMSHIEKQQAEIAAYTQRIQNATDAAERSALQREMRDYVRASNVALQEKAAVMKAEFDAEAR